MKNAIHARIVASAFVTLLLFMGLTGAVLDKAFRTNVENAQQQQLRTHIYSLLAAAELDDKDQLILPRQMAEPRLNLSESSLLARVLGAQQQVIWQSRSMQTRSLPPVPAPPLGQFSFTTLRVAKDSYTLAQFVTSWIGEQGEHRFVFQVAENTAVLAQQVRLFRKNLWGWLAGVSVLLIIVQIVILRWGLKPLRQVADDLLAIEQGKRKRLQGDYPEEITPLTRNLNQLLDSAEQQLLRYRDALGNMAHSLKTPIAVLQGLIQQGGNQLTHKDRHTAQEQLDTINNIVEYQLQRAATVGRQQLKESIALRPVAEKISRSLQKVYQDKSVHIALHVDDNVCIAMDENDLYEVLGNLLENACKWCQQHVRLSVTRQQGQRLLSIEDDGPGIDETVKQRILLRGQRADETTPGHGLGLAMVSDILLLYQATLQIDRSPLGGARFSIALP